jgi:hypothetical protein
MGRVYRTQHKIGKGWIEHRQPTDLLNQPSNMEMRLCWYQNKNGLMWTYVLTYCLMVKLEIFNALATMTYIVEINLYELHPIDE